jgi:two-component system sensor histidine kinase/response regulator
VQMPEMDGHETTRRVRAYPRFSALTIVAMTAHAMVEERERCFASGMNDHLSKPINPADLYRVIAHWCPACVATGMADPGVDAPHEADGAWTIAGFDVEDGLARTLGDRPFYLRLLAMFRDDQREVVTSIRLALAGQDRPAAERLAHTLKGVAGQVGARGMQTLAGELEQAIRRAVPPDEIVFLLERVDAEMQALQRALAPVLAEAEAMGGTADQEIDLEASFALISRLLLLLRESDGEAMDLLAESRQLLAAALGTEAHQKIERAARRFDFEGVLAALVTGAQEAGYEI